LKEAFRTWYTLTDREEAEQALHAWCEQALASGLLEMADLARTAGRRSWTTLLGGYTNAFTEGKNYRIKLLKRQGYGYRDFAHFRLRVLTVAA